MAETSVSNEVVMYQKESHLSNDSPWVATHRVEVEVTIDVDPFDDDWLVSQNHRLWKGFWGASLHGNMGFHGGGIFATQPKAVVSVGNYNEVYIRNMITARRGYPLFKPTYPINFPLVYRRKGYIIGDVGLTLDTGRFLVLFNIFRPADHPVNKAGVPPNFKPFSLKPGHVTRKSFPDSVCLPSSTMQLVRKEESQGGDHSEFDFEGKGLEGAAITLPCGVTSEDLDNLPGLHEYIAENIVEWYKYYKARRNSLYNGDLRVVIGTDKTTAWGRALYTSHDGINKDDFRLRFITDRTPEDVTGRYTCAGRCFEVLGGPNKNQHLELRDPEDKSSINFTSETMFLRTLNPLLGLKYWEAFQSGRKTPKHPPSLLTKGLEILSTRLQATSKIFKRSHDPTESEMFVPYEPLVVNPGVTVHSELPPIHRPPHPSFALNKKLLDQFPKSRMIFTSDHDWIPVLTEENPILPDLPPDLVNTILQQRRVVVQEGIVSLCMAES